VPYHDGVISMWVAEQARPQQVMVFALLQPEAHIYSPPHDRSDALPLRGREVLQRFPLCMVQVRVGNRQWQIRCVENQDRLLAASESLQHAPYGFLLWESSVALARWFARTPTLVRGKRVLELGAGVGLAGLVAQSLGAHVTQTDHMRDALAICELNAVDNGVSDTRQVVADWQQWAHGDVYDVIIGADILYETDAQPSLASIFQRNLSPGGHVLLADPQRPQALEFLGRLQHAGALADFAIESVAPTSACGDGKNVAVMLARLRWPEPS
jgi:predicted nicotinamide N-methyase